MSQSTCRWGILSTAAIARKVWNAIEVSENGCVAAVASRSKAKAKRFIDECSAQVPPARSVVAHGDYESLIADPNIDAVYIPLPTGLRKPHVVAAAAAGKHVLCEKPIAVHSSDLAEMLDACESAGVQFMDGVMFEHSQRWAELKSALHSSTESPIGDVKRIQSHFSFPADASFVASNIRADSQLEPHGCLGDLGWYCIRFTLGIMNGQLPESVQAKTLTPIQGSDSAAHVPGEFSAELTFAGGVTAAFYCSFLSANQQTALISGDRGYISVDDFVLPLMNQVSELNEPTGGQTHYRVHHHDLAIENCRWHFHRRTNNIHFAEPACDTAGAQEVEMVTRLAGIALSGNVDARFHQLSRDTQSVLDACRRSDASGAKPVSLSR